MNLEQPGRPASSSSARCADVRFICSLQNALCSFCSASSSLCLLSHFTVDISRCTVAALPFPAAPALPCRLVTQPRVRAPAHTTARATDSHILSTHVRGFIPPSPSTRTPLNSAPPPRKIQSQNKWRLHCCHCCCCCSRAEIISVFPPLAPNLVTNAQEPSAL